MSRGMIYNLVMIFSLAMVVTISSLMGFPAEYTIISVNVAGFGLLANMIGSIYDRA